MKTILPDFKTERTDVLPPLPAVLKVVPIGFVFSVLGLIGMAAYSFQTKKALALEEQDLRSQQQREQSEIVTLQQQESRLHLEARQAREVQNWVSGSTEIYPLLMKIARTVSPETIISELTLGRLEENPSHLKMNLKLHSPRGSEQTETLTQEISDTLRLRQYSASTTPADTDPSEVVLDCSWAPALAQASDK